MSDLDPLGSMVVRIIPGIKWVYDNPPPVANLALAKEAGNNVQRSLYFHVFASKTFRVFMVFCNARSTTVFEDKRKRRRCRRYRNVWVEKMPTNQDVKTTKKPYTLYRQLHGTQPVFFPHRGGFKGMVAQFRLVDFMCIVYMPRTQLTSIFEGTQPSKTRPFSSIKTRGPIWVLILFPMFSTAKMLVLDKWWASLECLWIIWPEGWSSGVSISGQLITMRSVRSPKKNVV